MSELVSTWNTGQLFFLQSLHSSRSAYWWPFYVEPKCHSITPHPPVCAAKGGGGRGLWHLFLCVYRLFVDPFSTLFLKFSIPIPTPRISGYWSFVTNIHTSGLIPSIERPKSLKLDNESLSSKNDDLIPGHWSKRMTLMHSFLDASHGLLRSAFKFSSAH